MLSQQNIKISLKLKSHIYVLFFILIGLLNFQLNAQNQKFKVVLDAGHGGKDPGTLGNASYKKSYESDVALKVALHVGKLLERHSEFKTIYTRKTNDVFVPLHKRGNIANKADADLFISIHCNSAVTKAYGTTTYVLGMGKSAKNLELSKRENDVILLEDDYEKHYDYDPNSEEFIIGLTLMQEDYQDKSIEFAQIVQNKFVSVAKRKNRGVNQGNLAVLYDSYMPSVLIEIGFLSNKIEEKFLHTKVGQQKIAKAIYEAVKTYKKRIDNNSIDVVISKDDDIISVDSIDETSQTNTVSKDEVIVGSYYKVQFATSKRKIETLPNNFKKLQNVERLKRGLTYVYSYGKTVSLIEAKKLRKEVVSLGYKDAFVKRVSGSVVAKTNTNVATVMPQQTNTVQNTKHGKTFTNLGYYYSVQIATSRKQISIRSYNFKGLKNVVRKNINGIYKYYYGSTINLDEARNIRKEVVNLYKDAFVKKLKGNIPIQNILDNNAIVVTTVEPKPNTNIVKGGIVFKVQISSGKRKFETKAYNFRGLKNIERVKIGSFYKYYYGNTNDYNLIKKLKEEAVIKGYKDATIVAIKNNKLVSINSALNNSK